MNKFVFKKVAELTTEKTELAVVKVDLALVDELANITKSGALIANELNQSVAKADQIKVEMAQKQKDLDAQVKLIQKAYNAADKWQTAEGKLYDKITKATAEVGIKKEEMKGWKEYFDNSLNVNSAINGANKYMV